MTNGKPSEVKRDSDFSVTVVFPSCRLASEFEREMKARSEDMTNGNSAERERFEKWIGQKRPDESGMEQYSWDDCWSAWEAALSVCADGGKGALGWTWERRYSNGGYTRKFCTSEFEARELAKDSESLSIPDLVYPFFARADGGKGEAVAWRVGLIVHHDKEKAERDSKEWGTPIEPLYTATQAECAPRETQPEKNHLLHGILRTAMMNEAQKELCASLAAPSYTADDYIIMENAANEIDSLLKKIELLERVNQERADADTAGAPLKVEAERTLFESAISGLDVDLTSTEWGYRCSATQAAFNGWLYCVQYRDVELNAAGASNERADAEKDAALTDVIIETTRNWFPDRAYQAEYFARAILAANKEKQS